MKPTTDRLICNNCGHWIYRTEEIKKKYDLENFERELKKWKKIAEEKERDANRTKRRNVGRKQSTKNSIKTK